MGIQFSILDQSPIFAGETPTEAFQHTIEIAQRAEKLGYYRFWVSEHHDSDRVVGSSPEVLISHLLAKTEKIRIGAGGIMLQHYSPYKVAENFNVLSSLAPGRVDLGIGRAPGGLPHSTRALQQNLVDEGASLSEKLVELDQFVNNRLPFDHPLAGLHASPIPPQPAPIYILGTSVSSAEIAAKHGLPYVFAHFINRDEEVAEAAFATYRNQFKEINGGEPQEILALSVIVADSDEEAAQLAEDFRLVKIHLESGKTWTVTSQEQAEAFGKQSGEKYVIETQEANIVHGSKEKVREKLLKAKEKFNVEELIITTSVRDFQKRVHSFELLKEAFAEVFVEGGE